MPLNKLNVQCAVCSVHSNRSIDIYLHLPQIRNTDIRFDRIAKTDFFHLPFISDARCVCLRWETDAAQPAVSRTVIDLTTCRVNVFLKINLQPMDIVCFSLVFENRSTVMMRCVWFGGRVIWLAFESLVSVWLHLGGC